MNNNKIYLTLFLSLIVVAFMQAQDFLTLEKALEIGLKNNFDIRISENNAETGKINNTAGNAGMLPKITVNSSGAVENNHEMQSYRDGSSNEYPSLNSLSVYTGIQLDWTLFDGGKMFVSKSKLNDIEQLGQIKFRNQVLASSYGIIAAFYNIVRQEMQLKAIHEVLNYNNERLKICNVAFRAGTMMKPDVLQAKMDENIIRESIIEQQFQILLAKKDLNILLGRDSNWDFLINDSISLEKLPEKKVILEQIKNKNTDILSWQYQSEIDKKNIRENQSDYLPTLKFKTGYYYSQNTYSDGNLLNNNSYGPQAIATLSIPVFNAGETARKVKLSKIALQNTNLSLEKASVNIIAEVETAFEDIKNQQELMEIETLNNEMAKENLEISLLRFSNGQATSIEIHQAQENFVQSSTRLFNFKYNLKLAETHIKQLMADL